MARELESKLAVETPSKKTPKKRTAAERRKTTQLTPPQTPRSKLAAEIENLSLRRSTRKSAIQATQQIKYTTYVLKSSYKKLGFVRFRTCDHQISNYKNQS